MFAENAWHRERKKYLVTGILSNNTYPASFFLCLKIIANNVGEYEHLKNSA